MVRASQNKVNLDEFHQWAGSLKANFSWVLAENLSTMIPTNRVTLFPWKRSARIDYQVTVHVNRFDVSGNGTASLVARWSLLRAEGQQLIQERKSRISKTGSGPGYEGKVSAMSMALEALSREIATTLNSVSKKRASL